MVLSDCDCPAGFAYMLQLNTWKMYCIEAPVVVFDEDGTEILRQASSDGVESRIYSYSQLACSAPGKNAVITLPALS